MDADAGAPPRGRLKSARRAVGNGALLLTVVGAFSWAATSAETALLYPGYFVMSIFMAMDFRLLGRSAERYARRGALALRFLAAAVAIGMAVTKEHGGWTAIYIITAFGMHLWERSEKRRVTEYERMLAAGATMRYPGNSARALQLFHWLRNWSMAVTFLLVLALFATTSPDGRVAAETVRERVEKTTGPLTHTYVVFTTWIGMTEAEEGSMPASQLVGMSPIEVPPECKVGDEVRRPEEVDRRK